MPILRAQSLNWAFADRRASAVLAAQCICAAFSVVFAYLRFDYGEKVHNTYRLMFNANPRAKGQEGVEKIIGE